MKRFMNKKVATIGLAAGLALGGAGAAFAYFSRLDRVSGRQRSAASAGLDIAQTNTVSNIQPNGATHEVDYTVTNNNPGQETVHQVTVSVASISGAGTLTGTDSLGNAYDACTTVAVHGRSRDRRLTTQPRPQRHGQRHGDGCA